MEDVKTGTAKPKTEPNREGIKVKALYFSIQGGREIPIPDMHHTERHQANSIIAGDAKQGKTRTEIEFRPWMRMHRVVHWVDRDRKDKAIVFYVPESWALWEGYE